MPILRPDGDPGNESARASRWLALLLTLVLTVLPDPTARAGSDGRFQPPEATKVAPPEPPAGVADGDPGKGLTLDEAVGRLKRENLTLRALALEVPQARADVTSAGQHPDSFLLVGDGRNGPRVVRLQPLDFFPRRWARVLNARLAAGVTEALYRDAVRLQTDNLYTAFVNVQATQQHVRFARASQAGVENLLKMTRLIAEAAAVGKADVARVAAELDRAAAALADAEVALTRAKLALADLTDMTDAEADRLEVADPTDKDLSDSPPVEELIRLALHRRPDLHAYRLGLLRARSELLKAWVEGFPDVYARLTTVRPAVKAVEGGVIAPQSAPDLLVSLPDVVHHRGRVVRAGLNVEQSGIELARVERQVVLDVRQAHLEHRHSLDQVRRQRDRVLPSALRVRDVALRLYQGGQVDSQVYLIAQKEYNDVVRQYGDAVIRHRRSMLALGTVVGVRVFP